MYTIRSRPRPPVVVTIKYMGDVVCRRAAAEGETLMKNQVNEVAAGNGAVRACSNFATRVDVAAYGTEVN